jgi:protein-L-isoaspartate(D-aspartate) O-methyltransferase
MDEKRKLIEEIQRETAETAALTGQKTLSPRLIAAFDKVRREAFLPETEAAFAYIDTALPIGHGQTISQPFIVALMTELLQLTPDDVVLEIGTGSGYQAAILAELACKVYSIEVVPELAERSRRVLAAEGYRNIEIRCGDGALGWLEHAPYDAIIVTAAAESVPPMLVEQLKAGGRMIVPVGKSRKSQRLVLIHKGTGGKIEQRDVLDVTFVPLITGNPSPRRS